MSAQRTTSEPGVARYPRHDLLRVELADGLCVLTLDNPPVNALAVNKGLVQAMYDAFAAGEGDATVSAFVVLGAGRNFCGGADISEFGMPYDAGKATVPVLAPLMDTLAKPIVAGLHGATMGGGLEVALACHYRIALRGAQIALPEVKLGVLPAAGGTQRIARLLGAARALDFVISGDVVTTEQAKVLGIVDEIADGDIRVAAMAYARRVLAEGRGVRRASALSAAVDRPAADFFTDARLAVAKAWRGYPAPMASVDCIEAAATRPFAEGLALEVRLFDELVATTASRALRHLFFAERKAGRVQGIPEGTPAHVVAGAGIAGGGAGGAGIAMAFAAAGIPVTIVDASERARDDARSYIAKANERAVSKGRLDSVEAQRRTMLVNLSPRMDDLAAADVVIEAVSDDVSRSRVTFGELDRVCEKAAVLAANTAHLDVNAIAAATRRPERVVGMHFFTPANVMRLVIVARGVQSSPAAVISTMALAKRLRKVAVCVSVAPGFASDGLFLPYVREAQRLVAEGATTSQVDAAARDFGLPMGPFALAALIGLDVSTAVSGVAPRAVTDDEIVERLVLRLVDVGARLVERGYAQRASDIDIVYTFGYGFPRYRGGPMFHADTLGLRNVVAAMRRYQARLGETWAPAPLLAAKAAQGTGFSE